MSPKQELWPYTLQSCGCVCGGEVALVKPVSFWSEAEDVLCQGMSETRRWHCSLVAGGREAIGVPCRMQACLSLSFPMAPSLGLLSSLPALPPHRLAQPAPMEGCNL